jgi:hypothetical protein
MSAERHRQEAASLRCRLYKLREETDVLAVQLERQKMLNSETTARNKLLSEQLAIIKEQGEYGGFSAANDMPASAEEALFKDNYYRIVRSRSWRLLTKLGLFSHCRFKEEWNGG